MALLLTFFSGLFFLVGIIIYNFVKNKTLFTRLSLSCASVVIIGLITFDLIPELIEVGKWWLIFFVIIGLFLLILIDKLVPHHEHNHHENDEEKEDHKNHIEHISTITIIALLLHNIIEGMALYGVATTDLKSGILMLTGIGLHNLPFGFQISATKKNNKNKMLITLLVLSGGIGGLIFLIFGNLSPILEGIIIALTLGMLLHILFFELLKEVYEEIHKKEWGDVSLRFTSRPVEKMKKVSSSSYQKKIKEAGGIEVYEARENNSVGSYKDEQEGKGEM